MADEFINIEVVNERAKQKLEELSKLFSKMGYSMDEAGERLDKVFGDGAAAKFEKIYHGLYVNEKALRAINETAAKGRDSFQQRIDQLETELSLTDETDKKKIASLEKEKDYLEANLEMHKKVADATKEQLKAQKDLEAELQNTISKQTYQANPQAGGVLNSFNELKAQAEAAGVMFDNLDERTTRALNHINDGLDVSARDLKKIIEDNEETIKRLAEESDKLGRVMDASEMDEGIKEKAKQRVGIIEDEIIARRKLNEVVQTAQKQKATGDDVENVRIRTRIMNLKQEIIEYRLAGKEESEYYQNMIKEVQTLQKEQHKLNAEMELLSSNHPTTQSILTGLRGISGGFAAAQGAMALFGSENKDLQKVMTKLQALMSITIGLQSVQQTLDKSSAMGLVARMKASNALNKARQFFNVLLGKENVLVSANTGALVANAGAATAGTKAVTGLSGAFKLLGSAIKKVPAFGWIIAAISAVIAGVSIWTNKLKAQREEEQKLREEEVERLKTVNSKTTENIVKLKQLSSEWKKIGNSVSAQNKFIKENASAFDAMGLSIKNATDAEDVLVKNTDKYIEAMLLRAEADVLREQAKKEMAEDPTIAMNIINKRKKRLEDEERKKKGGLYRNTEYDQYGPDATRKQQITEELNKGIETKANETLQRSKVKLEAAQELDDEADQMVGKQHETNTNNLKNKQKEIDLERETLETRIANMQEFFRKAREMQGEENVIGLNYVDKVEKKQLGGLIEDLYQANLKKAKEQKEEYEKQAKETITDQQQLDTKLTEIQENYNAKVEQLQNKRNESLSSLGGSAFEAEKKQFENMMSEAETAEQKLALVNKQIAKLQEADRNEAQNKFLADLQKQAADLTKDIAKQEADLYKELIAEYGSYTDQKKKIDEQYAKENELLNKKLNETADPAEKASIERAIKQLKIQRDKALKDLSSAYLKSIFEKAFDPEATQAVIKESLDALAELDTDTYNEDWLEKYQLSKEDWEAVKAAINGVKKELKEKVNGGLLDQLKEIREAFKKGEIEKAMQGLQGVASVVSDTISDLADALSNLADVTGNENLAGIASNMEKTANVISSTVSGAATGTQTSGSWIGGLVGGLLGLGTSLLGAFEQSSAEIAAAQKQRQEEAINAIYEGVQALYDNRDAMNSLESVITGLDYANIAKQLQSIIDSIEQNNLTAQQQLNFDNISTTISSNVDNMLRLAQNFVDRGLLDLRNLQNYGADYGDARHFVNLEFAKNRYANLSVYDLEHFFKENKSNKTTADFERLISHNLTAAIINYLKSFQGRKSDIANELREMQLNPENYTTMQMFGKMQEYRKVQREELEAQLAMKDALHLTAEQVLVLKQQIDGLTLDIREANKSMFEAFAGTDIAGIVNDWISIFDEFGTSGQLAFNKIDQSIDKMIVNMIRQIAFIKPLTNRITDAIKEAAGDDEILDEDEIPQIFSSLRGLKGYARQLYEGTQDLIKAEGISLDDVSGNSFPAAVKGVSEETAGIIAGQMNAIRVHQIEIQDILQNNISNNVAVIARNSAYLAELPQMNARLGRLETAITTNYTDRLTSNRA